MTENNDYTPAGRISANTGRSGNNFNISDLDLQALVDGALDAQQEKALRNRLVTDSAARLRYKALLEQKQLLIAWWRQFS